MQTGERNMMTWVSATGALRACLSNLRQRRLSSGPNDLIWSYLRQADTHLPALRQRLQTNRFHFNPLEQIRISDGHWVSRYEPEDHIVLARMKHVLEPACRARFDLSQACHLTGHGGMKGAVSKAKRLARRNRYVFKTDIANFYESINHRMMQEQMNRAVKDKRLRRLVWDSMERVHVCDGNYRHITKKGISRGCSLSPLMGAVYLTPLDAYAKANKLDYVRFMDDILFFANTRHKLKKVIREVYPILTRLELRLAKEKTWIGRVTNGFDYCGYRISSDEITVATRSFQRMTTRLNRRFGQGESEAHLVRYVKNWLKWATSGVVLDKERLIQKTVHILQSTFHFNWTREFLLG